MIPSCIDEMAPVMRLLLLSLLFPLLGQADSSRTATIVIDGPPPPVAPEVVSRDDRGRATIRAVRLDAPLVVDGKLDEAVYDTLRSVSGFIQQEPHEGMPATERTEVWVFFDRTNIYIAARCWDSHPERIVANEMRRDSRGIFRNANFAVVLDTFYDRRNAFFFHTNPLGGLYDAQITDERDVNRDWNTVWYVQTGRFPDGWTVEIAIPFKSLRYQSSGPQTWGINFRRIVRWKNELSYLTAIPASWGSRGMAKISSTGTLVGLETPGQSKNIEIKPYAISGMTTDVTAEPSYENDIDANAGFDFKYGLTRGLIADFTYNTDFAQVEIDEEQVNLTRFSLFFPEKREFFLEGQGLFQFGARDRSRPGRRSNTPILFFSRRIGLRVPIVAGGRLTGRAGKYSIGALNIQTGEEAAIDEVGTNFSVLRFKRDILRRSAVGFIGTLRSPTGNGEGTNGVVGADANFAFYENLRINGYYTRSRTTGVEGPSDSYQARFDYASDRYALRFERLVVEENFHPEIGFLRRRDFQQNFVSARFSPRPSSIGAIRKIGWETSLDYTTNNQGRLETREQRATFTVELENSDTTFLSFSRSFEFLPDPFEISPGVVLPAGGYGFEELWTGYNLGPQRRISGNLALGRGRFYDGERIAFRYGGRIEVTPALSVEPRLSWDWVNLPQGDFVTRLVSARLSYTLSARTAFSALIQYNSSVEAFSANLRFRWEYEPGSDLFVVFNEGRDTTLGGFPGLQNRALVVKLTKLFRF